MKDFVAELKWRGMIHDVMPGTEELLNKGEMVSAYIGFDPTADSLHIGSLVQIMTLVHFQECGHKPFALVGGATGMVGDPSGKSAERNLLSADILQHNLQCIKGQLEKFLDFSEVPNKAELVNNHDWFKEFSFLDFIRDVGKHITVNYMMAKDSVKSRLETGLSFTEFSYQLVQGYDFYWLWKNKNCKLQLGGSDQWGNIVTGTELIRRKDQGEAFALTTPLIKKADGTKFGKTEGGNVWLDKKRTSPYKFYQYWINSSDEDVKNYIRIFTLLDQATIEDLEKQHEEQPHLRLLQKTVAEEVTRRVHGQEELDMAIKASGILFSKTGSDDIAALTEEAFLSVFEGVPQHTISQEAYENCTNVTDLLSELTEGVIFASKGEARRMIKQGSVKINKEKVATAEDSANYDLIKGKYLMVQKGKKYHYLITVS
ncbi:MAG: tyrosine--tRNA ligase [Bacteroidota bacterium]